MNDDQLLDRLDAWLRENEVAPASVRTSTARAMAGVATTPQLGRWWPPAHLVQRTLPAAAAPRHPRLLATPPAPRTNRGILSMFSAVRVVAVAVVFVLVTGGLLVGPVLLPTPVKPMPAMTSPSPSAEASTEAATTAEPSVSPTVSPAPKPVPKSAESTFAATRIVSPFEAGSRPSSLTSGPQRTALFVDEATATAHMVATDGYRHTLATEGHQMLDWTMAAPRSIGRAGDRVVIHDAEGWLWIWAHNYERAPHALTYERTRTAAAESIVVDVADVPFVTVEHGRNTYDIHALDPDTGDLLFHRGVGYDEWEPPLRTSRNGRPEAIGLYADPVVHVLTEQGVERYEDGKRKRRLVLETPPGDPPDYRYIDGIGSDGKGQLWLYDAAGTRMVAFDKRDGRYLGSWAPGPGDPKMDDLRGVFVEGDGSGAPAVVTWVTPAGLMKSAVSDPSLVAGDVRRAGTHDGWLAPSDREPGASIIDLSSHPLRLEADALRLKTAGEVFRTVDEVAVGSDSYQGDADLELEWFERGTHQRLNIMLSSDDTHWWVREIWAYDGLKEGDWVFFEDLESLTRTPIGESLEGDLRIGNTNAERPRFQRDGSVRLDIDGLRLTAYRPSDLPAPLTDCTSPTEEVFITRGRARSTDPSRGDSSLAPLVHMTPVEAEQALQEMGLCYRFGYGWHREPFENARLNRFAGPWEWELRCSAPPNGAITKLLVIEDYAVDEPRLIVRVDVQDSEVRERPERPPYGTGCEPLALD